MTNQNPKEKTKEKCLSVIIKILAVIIILPVGYIGYSLHTRKCWFLPVNFLEGAYIGHFLFNQEWKEDWNLKTNDLAFLIITEVIPPKTNSRFLERKTMLKKWLKKVPNAEKHKLEENCLAIGNAAIECFQVMTSQLIQTGKCENDFFKAPSIQRYVDQFKDEQGFMEAWNTFKSQTKNAFSSDTVNTTKLCVVDILVENQLLVALY